METKKGINTICVHKGDVKDDTYGAAVSPLYMSTAYAYKAKQDNPYPRYFNSPNQKHLAHKIAALEHADAGLILGSGMAAVSCAMLSVLQSGDHAVIQNQIYGGTRNFIQKELDAFQIEYDYFGKIEEIEALIKPHTKLIYLETPSNPLLELVDLQSVANIAKSYNLVTMVDNTFATPINQTPIDFGIDIIIHSATKYLGGHSDITAGAIATNHKLMAPIILKARNFGGSLSDQTTWLLERSMKTLNLRVQQQNKNALHIAEYLEQQSWISHVNYPGLKNHPQHDLVCKQMNHFGGMLSFELNKNINVLEFLTNLNLIKNVLSLGGVETTILSPAETSHSLLSDQERASQGISNQLLRLSVGIENIEDIISDFESCIAKIN